MRRLHIGELARHAGVGVQTVRFYERKGLIEEPPRRESGYREYPPESLARLSFIRQAKTLGFSLAEIQDLLSLRSSPDADCADVRGRVGAKIADIQEKIRVLERMDKVLQRLLATCTSEAPSSQCPILDALESVPG